MFSNDRISTRMSFRQRQHSGRPKAELISLKQKFNAERSKEWPRRWRWGRGSRFAVGEHRPLNGVIGLVSNRSDLASGLADDQS